MHILIDFGVNIYAILLLILLWVIIKIRSEVKSFSFKLLKILIAINILILVVETTSWLVDGQTFFAAYFLGMLSNYLLTLLGTVFAAMWISYVDYKIFADLKRLKKRWYHLQPSLIIFIMLFFNFFTPLFFSIEQGSNQFASGPIALFNHFMIYLMFVYGIVLVFRHRYEANPYLIKVIVLFFFIPLIASILQIFESRLFFTWTTISLMILVVYVLLETNSGNKDFLTGIYSRQYFETYTRRMIEKKEPFGLCMLDFDNFKHVNDTYGHHQGDLVLIEFAKILKGLCKDICVISRLAGDEFMIVTKPEFDIEKSVAFIKNKMDHHGFKPLKEITFSYGFQLHDQSMNLDKLYVAVDKKMYDIKKSK